MSGQIVHLWRLFKSATLIVCLFTVHLLSALEWSGFLMPFIFSLCRSSGDVSCLTKYTDIEYVWKTTREKPKLLSLSLKSV